MKTSNTSKPKGLSLEWTKHLKTPEEKKQLEESIRHDTYVLGRLLEIIEDKIKDLDQGEISLASYDNPSWAYKQAHMNGTRQGLTTVKNLLSFLDQ